MGTSEVLLAGDRSVGKNYLVARRIATGGMAEVLLAAKTGSAGFEKLVVLKRILPHLREDGQFLQMFLNEARLAALLRHPNIVEIYDVERAGDADFVVVMEYLSGEDLRYIIGHLRQEQKTMDVAIGCRMITDAAAALHFAHCAEDMEGKPMGVVHRDVAPGNILVTYDGLTKLLDFGIAKASTRATYTAPGTMKGKFAYMSPEHIQQQPLDARSDVFSLGVVFWELLAAQRLFRGSNDAAVIKQVIERPIPLPSTICPAVPPGLDELVMACLERDPRNRPGSAGEVQQRLVQLLSDMDRFVTPAQVSEWMRTSLPWRFHQRREMERAVIKEARDGAQSARSRLSGASEDTNTTGTGSQLVAAFGGQRTRTGSYPGVTPVGLMRLSPATSTNLTVASPHGGSSGFKLGTWATLGLAAAGTLLLVLLVIGFYWLGSSSSAQQAVLVVHAVPEGATLSVDGRVQAQPVGAAGVAVPVRAETSVHVEVAKPGRLTQRRIVQIPRTGSHHIYLTLPVAPN